MRQILLAICTILMVSCGSQRKIIDSENEEGIQDQIVFHEFMALKDSEKISITEIDRVLRNGKIKEINNEESMFNHPLEVILLDKSDTRIASIFIEHPLIQEFEFADENGKLGRISDYKDSAIFTVRYNNREDLSGLFFNTERIDSLGIQEKLEIKK